MAGGDKRQAALAAATLALATRLARLDQRRRDHSGAVVYTDIEVDAELAALIPRLDPAFVAEQIEAVRREFGL